MSLTRRAVLASLPALGVAARGIAQAQGMRPLRIVPRGPARLLPVRLIGASVDPLLDLIAADVIGHGATDSTDAPVPLSPVWEDPAKLAAVKTMKLAFTRFPGGSTTNLYDWRSGRLLSPLPDDDAHYAKFWSAVAAAIKRQRPEGMRFEDYAKFSEDLGAEAILVANLETDTVASQSEWMASLARRGVAPRHVELGNEYYVGLGGDPRSLARWPDVAAQLSITARYAAAMRSVLPPETRFALPIADDGFMAWQDERNVIARRSKAWNTGIAPRDGFDAVTVHPYCRVSNLLPGNATAWKNALSGEATSLLLAPTSERDATCVLRALLAHYDQELEATLARAAARVPGKDIWITEWNPQAGDVRAYAGAPIAVTEAINLQVASRALFTMLRQPAVTMALYFNVSFRMNNPKPIFVSDGKGGFAPTAVAMMLQWFADAANGGASYQRFIDAEGAGVSGGGWLNEEFAPIEGAKFDCGGKSTILLQNAGAEARALEIHEARNPDGVEQMSLPDLASAAHMPAPLESVPTARLVSLPPYSLTRLRWD